MVAVPLLRRMAFTLFNSGPEHQEESRVRRYVRCVS